MLRVSALGLLIATAVLIVVHGTPSHAQRQLSVVVGDVVVDGGFEELSGVHEMLAAPFRGRATTVAELEGLAQALEALYQEAGYFLVRVTIPPQEVNDGDTFRLLVIDGYLEALHLGDVPARLRSHVANVLHPLLQKQRLTMNEFERVVTAARRLPGVTLRTTLVPGETVGASSLAVEGDWHRIGGSVSASRHLVPVPAPWSTALQVQLNQPFGKGEQFSAHLSGPSSSILSFSNAQEINRTMGGNVRWPLGHGGASLNVGYTYSNTYTPPPHWIIPATRSVFHRFSIEIGQAKRHTRTGELRLSAALEGTEQFAEAPDFDVELHRDGVRVLRLDAHSSEQSRAGVHRTLSLQLSQGLAWGARSQADVLASGVPFSRPGSLPTFQKANVTASWRLPFPWGAALTSTVRAQYAFKGPLPSTELFSVSGSNAMPSLMLGMPADDVGWTLREEIEKPFAIMNERLHMLLYGYAAAGASAPDLHSFPRAATALGLGVRAHVGAMRLSLEYARGSNQPLSDESLIARLEVSF